MLSQVFKFFQFLNLIDRTKTKSCQEFTGGCFFKKQQTTTNTTLYINDKTLQDRRLRSILFQINCCEHCTLTTCFWLKMAIPKQANETLKSCHVLDVGPFGSPCGQIVQGKRPAECITTHGCKFNYNDQLNAPAPHTVRLLRTDSCF